MSAQIQTFDREGNPLSSESDPEALIAIYDYEYPPNTSFPAGTAPILVFLKPCPIPGGGHQAHITFRDPERDEERLLGAYASVHLLHSLLRRIVPHPLQSNFKNHNSKGFVTDHGIFKTTIYTNIDPTRLGQILAWAVREYDKLKNDESFEGRNSLTAVHHSIRIGTIFCGI